MTNQVREVKKYYPYRQSPIHAMNLLFTVGYEAGDCIDQLNRYLHSQLRHAEHYQDAKEGFHIETFRGHDMLYYFSDWVFYIFDTTDGVWPQGV